MSKAPVKHSTTPQIVTEALEWLAPLDVEQRAEEIAYIRSIEKEMRKEARAYAKMEK